MADAARNMNIGYFTAGDDAAITVYLDFDPPADAVELERVETAITLFDAFAAHGGLTGPRDRDRAETPRRLRPESVVLSGDPRMLDREALGVLLRLLRNASARAVIGVGVGQGVDARPDGAENTLPRRTAHRFELEFRPDSKWATVECGREAGFDPQTVNGLDRVLRLWLEVARGGGFAVPLDGEPRLPFSSGASVDGPTVGADFVTWELNLPDMEILGIDALINGFAWFSEHRNPIEHLYVG